LLDTLYGTPVAAEEGQAFAAEAVVPPPTWRAAASAEGGRTMPKKIAALTAALVACCWALPVAAQDAVAQFYRGRTLTIVVGSSAGGGYDTYARMMARYFSKHMPGNPSVVPQNMPGAGSNLMSAYIANVAAKDGTMIGANFQGTVLEPLIGQNPSEKYDPSKLNYIGSANSDVYLCLARADAPVKTFADALTHELVLGASADGGSTRDFPVMLDNVLGTKFKIVNGYPGTREIGMAIENGEVQGQCGTAWSSLISTHPEWLRDHTVNILAQEETNGLAELNKQGVPRTVDFAQTPEQRQILELVYSQEVFARPFMVAAEVPQDRVEALRKAFMETWTDPDLRAEAKKINLDVAPISGADVQALIAKIYATPPAVIAKAKEALIPKS
jgi:tripartite-type tricarboxylate transporter receptor subunit TctC